jgi:putative ABC transport system permease protein
VLNNGPIAFGRHMKLAVRTTADPRALVASVRGEIASIDRQLALESIETMEERLGESVAPRRFSVLTLGAFAAGSLLLAAIGLYGLLAFNVAERRREIAVRMAIGAEPPAILRMVVGQGLKLVAMGLVAGALTSFWVARALTSLLYENRGTRRCDVCLRARRARADLAGRVRAACVARVTSPTDLRA